MTRARFGVRNLEGAGDAARVTPEIAAEAAVWVTILHGRERDRAMEVAFRAWLKRSPAHRAAFEKTTDVWMNIPLTKAASDYLAEKDVGPMETPARFHRRNWPGVVAVGILALVVFGALVIH